MPDTAKNHAKLNEAFADPKALAEAELPRLKELLIAATEMRPSEILNEIVKEGNPVRMETLKFFILSKERDRAHEELMARGKENLEVANRTLKVSKRALILSAIAVSASFIMPLVSLIKAVHDIRTGRGPTTP